MLTFYDWIYGVTQLAVGFLAVIAGIICLSMLQSSKHRELRAWRAVLIGLFLFICLQVIGGLRTFGMIPNTGIWLFIVHVLVSGILGLLILAITIQLQVNRGWLR